MSKTDTLITVKKMQHQKDKILNFKSQFFGKLSLSLPKFRLSLQIRVIIVVKHKSLKETNNLLYTL